MRILAIVLFTLFLAGCAHTGSSSPVDVPIDIGISETNGDVNTSITTSVQNIVSQLEVWQMGVIVGSAWLVGWLSPGPLEIIRGFFTGVSEVFKGFWGWVSLWRKS
ncbi:hypothetical protein AB9H28_24685 [Salmonella enterica subsp. enterica serovar Kentucky]|uniref:hypothetical protein n=1 Tax=Salmonella enterica TaxID=28901 RepID=UPI003F4C01C1